MARKKWSWTEVEIGMPFDQKTFCTGIVPDIEGNKYLFQNEECYSILNVYLDLGLTVAKFTPEGQKITEMIKDKKPIEEINDYLKVILIKNIEFKVLDSAVNRAKGVAYHRGIDNLHYL